MKFKLISTTYDSVCDIALKGMVGYLHTLYAAGYAVGSIQNGVLRSENGYYYVTVYIKSIQHLDKLVKVLGNDVIYSGDNYLTVDEGVFR